MADTKYLDFKMGKDDIPLDTYKAEVYAPQPNPNINATFTESANVTQAKLNLQNELNKNSGAYEDKYSGKINSILGKLGTNTPANINTQGIRQEFMNNLKRASDDTYSNLSKLSGGYGNTFGSSVADQQYQNALTYMNDINPAIAELSARISANDKQNTYNLLSALTAQDNKEYARLRDKKSDEQAKLDRLTDIYLSSLQNERNNFETDRNFEQGAYEFTEAQKQSAFEEYQDRLQSQVNQDNANKLDVWGTTWSNYWNAQDVNEANKQNSFKKAYNDYQLAERAKSIAAQKAAALKKAQEEKEKDGSNEPFVYNPDLTFKDTGVSAFINNHPIYEDVYNSKKSNQLSYLGADNFEDYLNNEIDEFTYEVNGKKYKLTDTQKMQILAHYEMNKAKNSIAYNLSDPLNLF